MGPEILGCRHNVLCLGSSSTATRVNLRTSADRFADAHREHVELSVAGLPSCCGFVATEGTHPGAPVYDMGPISGLIGIPIARVRGGIRVAEKYNNAAGREVHEPEAVRACPVGCAEQRT